LVIIILLSGAYIVITQWDSISRSISEESIVDNRISPLMKQAVYFEIHRIRRKGIIDVMYDSGIDFLNIAPTRGPEFRLYLEGLRPGFGWNEKPIFSYIAVLDGFEWVARHDFETWDTDYINQQIYIGVEEEQPSAIIEFTFVEKQKKGLRIQSHQIESFEIIYDFRTGYWDGDDYFMDSDGYGHFDGDEFEIWFSVTQNDYDTDGLPYWAEINVLGTNPRIDDSKSDPDKDGIPIPWEYRWGYNPFKWDNHSFLDPDSDGLQNIEEYKMEKWLADPFYPEIYLEVDEMEKAPLKLFEIKVEKGKISPIERPRIVRSRLDGWDHIFWEESQQMLIDLFNQHDISMHIDDGCMGGGGDKLPFGFGAQAYRFDSGVVAGFYANNFADDRKGIYRYVAVLHGGGWCAPQDAKNWFDCMTVPSNFEFFKTQLNYALSPRSMRIGRAVQVLHELGHSLGFLKEHCRGVDNSSRRVDDPNYPWLDYVSVMNYDYFRQRYFDYSYGENGEFDANDWDLLDLTLFQRPWDNVAGVDFFTRYH
jgi:hypothetical protein